MRTSLHYGLPFWRERFPRSGTCVGLAIVKNIIDLHRGEIVCTSTEGVGSEFSIWLPSK